MSGSEQWRLIANSTTCGNRGPRAPVFGAWGGGSGWAGAGREAQHRGLQAGNSEHAQPQNTRLPHPLPQVVLTG